MDAFTRAYTDLDRAIDEVQSLPDVWPATTRNGTLDADIVHCTSLVLHEWIANLLQHADFAGRRPSIEIRLQTQDRHVTCAVIDNSQGFDLETRLPEQEKTMEELPERGMGLRIIDACTGELSYTSTEAGTYCFKFSIPADHDPWLSMLF